MATDAVATNDMVRVTYHDMGGGVLHAATVRVTKSPARSNVTTSPLMPV